MKVYVKDENCNAKNSTTFYSNNIRNVPIEDDEIMHISNRSLILWETEQPKKI